MIVVLMNDIFKSCAVGKKTVGVHKLWPAFEFCGKKLKGHQVVSEHNLRLFCYQRTISH